MIAPLVTLAACADVTVKLEGVPSSTTMLIVQADVDGTGADAFGIPTSSPSNSTSMGLNFSRPGSLLAVRVTAQAGECNVATGNALVHVGAKSMTIVLAPVDGCPGLVAPEMVRIPAGASLFGSPPQSYTLPAFDIDVVEVTRAAYRQCVASHDCPPVDDDPYEGFINTPLDPQNYVDWIDADIYCRSVGKRLPTRFEWEKAARGTDGKAYPWGTASPDCSLANYAPNPTAPVGAGFKVCWSLPRVFVDVDAFPNSRSPFGLYNMAGNVAEWTSTFVSSTEAITMGGGAHDTADRLDPTLGVFYSETAAVSDLGFRCARDVN